MNTRARIDLLRREIRQQASAKRDYSYYPAERDADHACLEGMRRELRALREPSAYPCSRGMWMLRQSVLHRVNQRRHYEWLELPLKAAAYQRNTLANIRARRATFENELEN